MSSLLSARKRLVALLVIAASFAAVPAANAAGTFTGPKDYYVAVGDSLAFGYQQAKLNNSLPPNPFTYSASLFNTGYVDDFATAMHASGPNPTQTVNFGCPGETSSTLLNATNATTGCTTFGGLPIHQNHPGTTQIAAAVSFLNSHANQTSPVTLDIGANDLLAVIRGCAGDPACIQAAAPAAIGAVAQNTGIALAQLKAAAPRAKIIVLGLYNPTFTLPGGDQLTQFFNATIAQVAASQGAAFADPFNTINHGAAYPNEAASVCSQIAICTPLQDIHPFDNGYQAIADVIFGVSGY